MASKKVEIVKSQIAKAEVTRPENGYKDPVVRQVLTKQDLNKMVWRSLLLQASFNFERMQAAGWTYGLIPGLKKIHKDKEDLSKALSEHMEFFNTHPFLVTVIQGIILAMEENKESRDAIRGVKIAMMGPLGGIGDALFWLTLLPITAGIGAALAAGGNILGPILFLVVFNIVHFGLRFFLMHYGYNTGTKAIASLKEGTQKVSRAASILGLTVVGALVATFINLNLDVTITAGEIFFNLQHDVIDSIMPALLPLLYTFFGYWLLKKGKSPLLLIGITIVLGFAIYWLQATF